MVAEGFRARAAPYIARVARPFLGWEPNRISALALGLAALGGILAGLVRWTTPYLFLPVAVLIFLSGTFDVIDGEVARRTGKASRRGDFLDHVYDRYADVFLLVGIAISGYVSPVLALLALVSLLLTSYMGTQAQAVGVGREYSGLLSRADRLLLLALVALLEFLFVIPWPWAPATPWASFEWGAYSFTVFDLLMVYFIVAGQVTAVLRARSVYGKIPA